MCAGIVVNAGPADVVRIRGMTVNQRALESGVGFVSGKALHLENSTLINSEPNSFGLQFAPTGAAKLFVSDSHIIDNGSSGLAAGISIKPASGVTANVTIERTRINNNFFGIIADGTGGGSIRGVVRDSVVSGNINNGITVASSGVGAAVLSVENTTVSGNNFGLAASGARAGMLVSHSSIVLNNTGLFTSGGGVLLSYGDNRVNGNTTADGAFTGTIGLR
jgi:hypothetical protein